ncbi:glycosyltransferase [Alloacidobacterium dinghuense]|uniref:Glycosyltransferase n=1 Tax=Alloacidobacterium dinghuense TaxID=2763107 RepID=A0A7G8BDS2_9BACT|nr:glycosyltransferase [Alloacidobacterium dinghuense]QNI30692.1 glycosyltransferase [Alloacidobacterium dinghuense]
MAHLGFLTLHVMGHLFPMSTLAAHLKSRGHRVTFFAFADSEAFITQAGLECVVVGREEFPLGYVKRAFGALSRMSGIRGIRYTVDLLCKEVGAQLATLPEAIREAGIDALIIDQFYIGGSTVADHLQLPYVHVANALLSNVDKKIPPIIFTWSDERGFIALARIRLAHAIIRKMFQRVWDELNRQRQKWGLPVYTEFLNERFGAQPQICQQPRSFEFPRNLPPTFHFVGPLHKSESRPGTSFPWERIDGRPLIYASMGTLQNGLEWVFRAIAEGCAGVDAQLVLSLGGNMDPAQFSQLPGDPVVVQFAPQLEVLKRAALCITHAGLNTALESLAQGVPMVAIPITNDQPGVAARIVWTGTGQLIPLKKLTANSLQRAVSGVMSNSTYRENARRFRDEIANLNSLERASEIVESVLR